MELEIFLDLPTAEIACLVREAGPKVCVFPINGTRRWFMLEHPQVAGQGNISQYLDITGKRHIELYQLFFEHGVDTLLTPVFGLDLLERGEEYVTAIGIEGLSRLASHPDFLEFYKTYDVQVRFYGDYRKFLQNTPNAHLLDLFDTVTRETHANKSCQLLFGVFAHDAAETIAELSINYYLEHKTYPDKHTLVELYYGGYVPSVNFFIGFDKFSAYDMPLIATGNEDLYFTVAPSPYLNVKQLRTILYDHLYARPEQETDYSAITAELWESIREFYRVNRNMVQGVGQKHPLAKFWYPLPQVKLSDCFRE
ncbi:MAG: diterpene synthase [Anaerolineae bacterium]|nr:diterpene synthase [Anaerolineae bacterium]